MRYARQAEERIVIVRFLDLQDEANPANGTAIVDGEQLSRVLDNLRTRQPFGAKLYGENGYSLTVGIGGAVGFIQYSRTDGDSPYLVAVANDSIKGNEYLEFMVGNTPTPISISYILPFETVKRIASYFLETGARSATVSWEGI
jgi:hypothetical protein